MSALMTEQQLAEIEQNVDLLAEGIEEGYWTETVLALVAEIRRMRQVFDNAVLTQSERVAFDQRQAGRTLADIGKDLGCSRERVRQLEARAAWKIRGAGASDA